MHEEISKHTKKAYKLMKSDHTFIEKLKEISIEIGIIVFAVTLSIWLHGWSEHRHQQAEVKEFLVDLKQDLKADLAILEDVNKRQIEKLQEIDFLKTITSVKIDSLEKVNSNIKFNASINISKFQVGNYEGFKSSGKIGYIENKQLKKKILEYYQSSVPTISEFDDLNKNLALKLFDYIDEQAANDNKGTFLNKKLKSKLIFYSKFSAGYIAAYTQVIKEIKDLVMEIEKNK